jgi:glutathione synthase/RimK-type ligase-like ATP-grasp enzyme
MDKKRIGVIEYHDELYIKRVMEIIKKKTGAKTYFLSLRNYDFHKFGDFSVIYDMLSPFNRYLAEIMKLHYLNGTYIINNPFTVSNYNKILQIHKLIEMKMPIPETIVLPNESEEIKDGFVKKPSFNGIKYKFKYPFIMKPYDGYANCDVFVINSKKDFYKVYNTMKQRIMLVQEAIVPVDFYRVFCVNKKHVCFMKRKPRFIEAKDYDFYDFRYLTPELKKYIEKKTIQINKEIGYDMSTVEWSITEEGNVYVIDVNDAPNIADPKKAKQMDLFFPVEVYNWLVEQISEMIIEKLNMYPQKKGLRVEGGFNSMQFLFSKLSELKYPIDLTKDILEKKIFNKIF